MNNEKIPGELVTQVTCAEILISTGIQCVHFAHDLAFTDAAFGEAWTVEAANRLASISEILNLLYKRLPERSLRIVIDLPDGMVGVRSINPNYDPEAGKPEPKGTGDPEQSGGLSSSIDDFPF